MKLRILSSVVATIAVATAPALCGVTLKSVQFPATLDATSGSTSPPSQAPLSQTIVFNFSGKPKIGPGIASGVRIEVSSLNVLGQPVGQLAFGSFKVSGKKLIFTPRLATVDLPAGFGPTSDVAGNAGLPGLLPQTTYEINIDPQGGNAIKNLSKISPSLAFPIIFTTAPTTVGSIGAAGFYAFASTKVPKLVKKNGVLPKNKTTGIHPNVLSDPGGLFTSIPASKKPPFTLHFTAPLNAQSDNLLEHIRVRAVLDASATPIDVPIPCAVVLTENVPAKSTVLIFPNGTLPFGYTIVVEVSDLLENISGVFANDGSTPEAFAEVARYVVAVDPTPGVPIDGQIFESYEDNDHEDSTIVTSGAQLASWNGQTPNALRASFGFGGDGSLGAFSAPSAGALTITLDTDFQTLPLLSGATPDVAPGTVVKGGVFKFTDFHLPANCTLVGVGTNPLVITATGDVLIEGAIDCSGADGIGDDTFNSAVVPAPGGSGGAGGGKGGDGHPVFVPKGAKSLTFMITPQFGQNGFGPNQLPIGGGGGQSGCTLPWPGFSGGSNCGNFNEAGDGSRGSGGGGGSFNVFLPLGPEPTTVPVSGRRGGVGIGNHLPLNFSPGLPFPTPNNPKAYDGVSFNAVARPNPNPTFAEAFQQGLIFDAGVPFNITTSWALTKRVTFGGSAGQAVFADADSTNDYIGPAGEIQSIIGGQGGGGGGSRTEGLSLDCISATLQVGFPLTVLDAKGAGGGGAGGAILIQAIGEIRLKGAAARVRATGGNGKGGETTEGGDVGGNGGGGSGGAVVLQSAVNVVMELTANPNPSVDRVVDVSGGCGFNAFILIGGGSGTPGGDAGSLQVGDGAPGGPGIIQIQVPIGTTPTLGANQLGGRVWKSVTQPPGGIGCPFSTSSPGASVFIDVTVPLVKTPTPFSSISKARSTWYDLGFVSPPFRPLVSTTGGNVAGPVFGIPGGAPLFQGTNPANGLVQTDAQGNVLNAFANDFDVDAPDLGLPDFLPQGANLQTMKVRFQGADEDALNPGFPNLTTATAFVTDATLLNGRRFVRYEVEFNIAAAPSAVATPLTPRPQVNFFRIPFKY